MRTTPAVIAVALWGLVAASCGGGDAEDRPTSCADRSGTPAGAKTVLRIQGHASREDIEKTVAILCRRFERARIDNAFVRAHGARAVAVFAPEDASERVRALARVGEVRFYDWEPNVLGPRGPDRPYTGTGARDEAAAVAARQNATRPVLLEAERAPGQPARIKRFFVIDDEPELSGSDVTDTEYSSDPVANKPVVNMELTPRGRRAFARLTKRAAERGARTPLPQRFAIVLDERIVSLPTIDARQFPDGLDGRSGVSISGLSEAEGRALPVLLATGPLPVPLAG